MILSIRAFAVAAGLFPCLPAIAQEAARQGVSPDKGTVDSAGKFIPKDSTPAQPEGKAAADEAWQRESMQVLADGPDRFRIGTISFDRKRREVTIPATVNMDSGIVEYALVAETGKVHEALFTTKAKPREIHLACLLLGLPKEDQGKADDAGFEVKVNVAWDGNGPSTMYELANLVVTSETPEANATAKPLSNGPWNYVSSSMATGGFAAALEGSVIALIHDPAALVVNPRDNAKRDDVHVANRSLIPPKGNAVRIILTLPAPPAKP